MARLVMTNKADIVSVWSGVSLYHNIKYPSIIVLKRYIRKKPLKPRFNFRGVFKRDRFICQYTNKKLSPNQLTVDHVIPKSRGGKSTWENCATASLEINAAKGNKTPEEAGLTLIRKPQVPSNSLGLEFSTMKEIHPDWTMYFPDIERS